MAKVIDVHKMEIVPIIYPVRHNGNFGDESERLENLLNINLSEVRLPQMVLIHGATKQNTVFPHKIDDQDRFIGDLVAYWSIMHLLKADHSFIEGQITQTSTTLETVLIPADQREELNYDLKMQRKAMGEINAIMAHSEHAYNLAVVESRYSVEMKEKNIIGKKERVDFVQQAYAQEMAKKTEAQAQEVRREEKSPMEMYIEQLEADLIARGVTDETERLTIIVQQLERLDEQQQRELQLRAVANRTVSYSDEL